MSNLNLHEIANSGGYGTGKKARDIATAKADRRSHIPSPKDMNEMFVGIQPDGLVASFGYDAEDGKDYHLNTDGEAATVGFSTAGQDARAFAALWNAYRDGDLVWKDKP